MTDQTEATAATDTDTGGNAQEPKRVTELPEWAQNELSRARNDAATYRTKLRETEKSLSETQAELNSTVDRTAELEVKLNDVEISGLKLEAALEVGVPGEHLKAFADRLRGNNSDELKADAEAAMAMFGVTQSNTQARATDPTAGLGNQPKKTGESAFGDFVKGRLSR